MGNNFKLVGLSKDRVRLIHSEREIKVFVRKTADPGIQSKRLMHQYKLLEEWSNSDIKVPQLFKKGLTHKSEYFFEMEYINAPSLAHLVYNPTKKNILKLDFAYQRLISYFEVSFKEQVLPNKNHVLKKIYKKLKLLKSFFKKFSASELKPEIIYMILNLEINLKKYNLFSNIGDHNNLSYKVHGDLTLSNLLVGDNSLYFIDLNEHFLGNTIVSDISKIMFDLDFNLSLKLESKDLRLDLSTLNLTTNLKNKFFELCKNYINFILEIKDLLLIIESMRVLQYVLISNINLSNILQIYIIEKFKSLKNKNILCKL